MEPTVYFSKKHFSRCSLSEHIINTVCLFVHTPGYKRNQDKCMEQNLVCKVSISRLLICALNKSLFREKCHGRNMICQKCLTKHTFHLQLHTKLLSLTLKTFNCIIFSTNTYTEKTHFQLLFI